jgi:ABC-2 type transport system ATP-binding protein
MEDVASLCRRVIIIDAGKLRYDGDLSELVRSIRPGKRIALRFGPGASIPNRDELVRVGTVVELDTNHAVLDVEKSSLREAVAHLLSYPGVFDLSVEDPPLEEVMRELFARRPEHGEDES